MIKLGTCSYLGTYYDNYHALVTVGNFTSVANGATFLGVCEHAPRDNHNAVSNFNFRERLNWDYPECTGRPIVIGNDVWIGENVLIVDGANIGDGCIVGAGSVVVGGLSPFGVYAGNPANLIRFRFTPEIIAKLEKIQWWLWPDDDVKARLPLFSDVNQFIATFG
jgi:acetyltransferase-like isoleucine patch superfamily enzyme